MGIFKNRSQRAYDKLIVTHLLIMTSIYCIGVNRLYLQQYMQLSREAIPHMLAIQEANDDDFIVQVSKIAKKNKHNYLSFQLTDGKSTCKGYIEVDQPHKDLSTFIKTNHGTLNILIKAHMTHQIEYNQFIIELLEFEVLNKESKMQKRKKETERFVPIKEEYVQLLTEKKFKSIKYQDQGRFISKNIKLEQKKIAVNHIATDYSEEETSPYQLTDTEIRAFERISDLYESFYGWEILVRVIDRQYKDFVSKGGKPTKILNVQLIDKAGDIIQAVFFNQFAQTYNSILQTGRVFRMSRGSIKQQKLQSKKNQIRSRYSIVFGRDSCILEVKDVPSIPLCVNNWSRLSQVLSNFNSLQQYTVVAIILSVDAQKTILKGNKEIVMQSMQIGDPISYNHMQVVVWNKQVAVDLSEFMNKSVLLKHFKVIKYKDQLNLNSTFKSDIIIHPFFKNEQGKFKVTFHADQGKIKSLRQLKEEIVHIGVTPIYSNLILTICSINVQSKWYYEACPNSSCRKSAANYSKCSHCFVDIEECCRKFMLPVQFCDSTGGIWVTAFDENARVLLNKATIEQMLQFQKSKLKQFVEKKLYNSFKVTVCSKKDSNGNINHNLTGQMTYLEPAQTLIDNLTRIKSILNSNSP